MILRFDVPLKYRLAFKEEAKLRNMSMVALLRELIESLPSWQSYQQCTGLEIAHMVREAAEVKP